MLAKLWPGAIFGQKQALKNIYKASYFVTFSHPA